MHSSPPPTAIYIFLGYACVLPCVSCHHVLMQLSFQCLNLFINLLCHVPSHNTSLSHHLPHQIRLHSYQNIGISSGVLRITHTIDTNFLYLAVFNRRRGAFGFSLLISSKSFRVFFGQGVDIFFEGILYIQGRFFFFRLYN